MYVCVWECVILYRNLSINKLYTSEKVIGTDTILVYYTVKNLKKEYCVRMG